MATAVSPFKPGQATQIHDFDPTFCRGQQISSIVSKYEVCEQEFSDIVQYQELKLTYGTAHNS